MDSKLSLTLYFTLIFMFLCNRIVYCRNTVESLYKRHVGIEENVSLTDIYREGRGQITDLQITADIRNRLDKSPTD